MKVTSRYDYLGSTAIFLRNQEYDFHKKRLQTIRSNSTNQYYNPQHVESIKVHNAQKQHANKFYETAKQSEIACNNNKILRKIIQISNHNKDNPNNSNLQQSTTIQSSTISPVRRPNPQQAQDIIRENNLLSTKILSAESSLDPRKFAQDYQHMKECKKRIQRFEVIDYSLNHVKLKAEDVANRSMQFTRKNSFYSQANPQSSLRTSSIPPNSANQEGNQSQIMSPVNITSTTRQTTTPRQNIIDKSIRTRSCEKDQSRRQERKKIFSNNNHRIVKQAESDQPITKPSNSIVNSVVNQDNRDNKDIINDGNDNSNKTQTDNNDSKNMKADFVIKTENIYRKQEKPKKEDNNNNIKLSSLTQKNGIKQQPFVTSVRIENRKTRSFSGVGESQKYNQDNLSSRQKKTENENAKPNQQIKIISSQEAETKVSGNNNQQIKQESNKQNRNTENKAISTPANSNGVNNDKQDNLFRMQFGKGALKKGGFNTNQSNNNNNSSLAWDGHHGKSNQTKISAKPQVFKPADEKDYEEDGFEDEIASSPIKESISNSSPVKELKKENNKSQK